MSDARGEGQVVEDGVGALADVGILAHLNDLELLGAHEAVGDLLGLLLVEVAVGHVDLLDVLEVREDTADSLSILK